MTRLEINPEVLLRALAMYDGPQPYRLDYGEPGDAPSLALYEADWHRWRAIRRDAEQTAAERQASLDAAIWWLQLRDPSWRVET